MQLHSRTGLAALHVPMCQVPCEVVNDFANILSNSRAAVDCGSLCADEALAYDIQVR